MHKETAGGCRCCRMKCTRELECSVCQADDWNPNPKQQPERLSTDSNCEKLSPLPKLTPLVDNLSPEDIESTVTHTHTQVTRFRAELDVRMV